MQLDIMGTSVYVNTAGEGRHSALLLHGWGCSSELMAGVQGLLSRQMRTAAIDFPIHGKSGKPPVPWGVPEYMEMTAEVIRRLELGPCDIVAHSFGARVAILLAATYPHLVDRMVLTGAAGIKKPANGKANLRTRLYKGLRGAMDLAEKTHLFGGLPDAGREALVQRFGSEDYRALDTEERKTFVKVINQDLTEYLPKISASTLLFWGAEDTATPLWMGQKMEELIPDAGLVVENGTGHFAYLERNEKFLAICKNFLMEGR